MAQPIAGRIAPVAASCDTPTKPTVLGDLFLSTYVDPARHRPGPWSTDGGYSDNVREAPEGRRTRVGCTARGCHGKTGLKNRSVPLIVLCAVSTLLSTSSSGCRAGRAARREVHCDEVRQCVARYAKPKLSPADIKRYLDEGQAACFARDDAEALAAQGACLPLALGQDERNGKTVALSYFCTDICPTYGGVLIHYAGVAEGDCCALGGYPWHDGAWGVYRGCDPPEGPLPKFNYPRRPGGPMDLATRSPCDPNRITFEDGTVIEPHAPPKR